jgi:hypothetical protein
MFCPTILFIDTYTYRFEGSNDYNIIDTDRQGSFRSPGFPLLRASDAPGITSPITYFIHGLLPTDGVALSFSDFDISASSLILVSIVLCLWVGESELMIDTPLQIYDGANRTAPRTAFRRGSPFPYSQSSSQHLLVEYFPGYEYTNRTNMGFRADYVYGEHSVGIVIF